MRFFNASEIHIYFFFSSFSDYISFFPDNNYFSVRAYSSFRFEIWSRIQSIQLLSLMQSIVLYVPFPWYAWLLSSHLNLFFSSALHLVTYKGIFTVYRMQNPCIHCLCRKQQDGTHITRISNSVCIGIEKAPVSPFSNSNSRRSKPSVAELV